MKCDCGKETRTIPDKSQGSIRHPIISGKKEIGFNYAYPAKYASDKLCGTCIRKSDNIQSWGFDNYYCTYCGHEWLSRGKRPELKRDIVKCGKCGKNQYDGRNIIKG